MKAAKEEWIEEQCKSIEKVMMSRNSKKAYNTLQELTTFPLWCLRMEVRQQQLS